VAGRRAVLLVNCASVLTGFAMFANMLVTTQFLQMPAATDYGLGLDPLRAGLWMVPSAAAFGLMAPASAWLTRRYSPQLTMLCGATVMSLTYVARVFFSDNLGHVVVGSVVVSVGTAMTYGAMPTLIMRAVPVTETASANGLNVLLRAVGTSTASAASAAISTAFGVVIAGQNLPSLSGLTLLFWLAAFAAFGAAVLAIPMLKMHDFAEEAGRPGSQTPARPARVVRGQVLDPRAVPIRTAVVSVLTPTGEPVDWGQADSEGWFTAAIPAPGDYLVVTAADGWQPRSRIMTLTDGSPLPPIVLRQRLTLTGLITGDRERPVSDALVVLTRASGETVGSTRTDHDGRYEIPRPANGRYVLTVVDRGGALGARPVTVWEAARSVDLRLGTPLA
jgi:MFS family permease